MSTQQRLEIMQKIKSNSKYCLFILPLAMLVALRLLGFDGMVGQDSYAYVDYSKALKAWLFSGQDPGDFSWPPGFPFLGAILSYIGLSVPISLQLISCGSLSLSLIIVAQILKEIYPRTSDRSILLYLMIFGVFCPYYLRSAMLTTSDMLACCLVIWSVRCAVHYSKSYRTASIAKAIVLTVIAALVRYPTILMSSPLLLFILYSWMRRSKKISHLLILVVAITLLALYGYVSAYVENIVHHGALVFWRPGNYLLRSFDTIAGHFDFLFPNIVYVLFPFMHYGFMLLGSFFLLVAFRSINPLNNYFKLGIAAYICYALFLAGINTQNSRYLLMLYPFVLIFCYAGFNKLQHYSWFLPMRKPCLVLGLLGQILLCALAFKSIFLRNALEQKITESVMSYAGKSESNILYSFDIDVALNSRGIPFQIVNLWKARYQKFEVGALLLFNEKNLSKQWAGLNPMLNWQDLKMEYDLVPLQEFDDNWKLYRIE